MKLEAEEKIRQQQEEEEALRHSAELNEDEENEEDDEEEDVEDDEEAVPFKRRIRGNSQKGSKGGSPMSNKAGSPMGNKGSQGLMTLQPNDAGNDAGSFKAHRKNKSSDSGFAVKSLKARPMLSIPETDNQDMIR